MDTEEIEQSPRDLLKYEREYIERDYRYIAGVDEVGRGCLFGDVVAAAVILPEGLVLEGVDDSKKLSAKKRDLLYDVIMEQALAVSVGYVDARTIDEINIKQAARLAMKKAVLGLTITADFCWWTRSMWTCPFHSWRSSKGTQTANRLPRLRSWPRLAETGCVKENGRRSIPSTASRFIRAMQPNCTVSSWQLWDRHRCIAAVF